MSRVVRQFLQVCLAAATGVLMTTVPVKAASAAGTPIEVNLGTHVFGRLTPPGSVPLHARPDQVGFHRPSPAEDIWGPWSFQVATDGTIWLLDEENNRLLAWPSGAAEPSGTVPVGPPGVWDFVVTPDRTVYYTTTLGGTQLHKVTAAGQALWDAPLAANGCLRLGPDGVVYLVDVSNEHWLPATTIDGKPLPVADQQRLAKQHQPLPGGGSLAVTYGPDEHRIDVALLDAAGKETRTWRVTSTTAMSGAGFVPAMVGGEAVIGVQAYEYQTDGSAKVERLVLQLTATGTRTPIVVAPHTYGAPVTDMRVGPDGAFYHLTTDPATGATIARYPLAAAVQPAPTGGAVIPGPTTPGAATPTATQAESTGTAAANPPAARNGEASGGWAPWLWGTGGGLLAMLVTAVTILLVRRRRRLGAPPETTGDLVSSTTAPGDGPDHGSR